MAGGKPLCFAGTIPHNHHSISVTMHLHPFRIAYVSIRIAYVSIRIAYVSIRIAYVSIRIA